MFILLYFLSGNHPFVTRFWGFVFVLFFCFVSLYSTCECNLRYFPSLVDWLIWLHNHLLPSLNSSMVLHIFPVKVNFHGKQEHLVPDFHQPYTPINISISPHYPRGRRPSWQKKSSDLYLEPLVWAVDYMEKGRNWRRLKEPSSKRIVQKRFMVTLKQCCVGSPF